MRSVCTFYLKKSLLTTRKETFSPRCTVLCESCLITPLDVNNHTLGEFYRVLFILLLCSPCRVNGHDVSAGLLLKAFGPDIVNVRDAKGR